MAELKKGDVVELDCGYFTPDDQPCELLENPVHGKTVFETPTITARVRQLGTGQIFDACLDAVVATR